MEPDIEPEPAAEHGAEQVVEPVAELVAGLVADGQAWQRDSVVTRDGVVIPVRATSRRPGWTELPVAVRARIEATVAASVVGSGSTGSGFTPGFASRLDLSNGSRVFVKAASTGHDRLHGWQLTHVYREEIRKLAAMPAGVGAPALLWSLDEVIDDENWVVIGLEYVDGRPPRRPWLADELRLVTAKLAEIAPLLATVPAGLDLGTFADDFGGWQEWLSYVEGRDGRGRWLDTVEILAAESVERCSGTGIAHLDLRDDNILIDRVHRVWICDWNFPMRAAPWVDLVCVLLSAHGDGLDADSILAEHPLTRAVDPRSVDALLANLWLYFACQMDKEVPEFCPHLRDHQRWYEEVTADWLRQRLGSGADSSDHARGLGA